ncbi:LamG-like jellyroll fold domain-containing protein [Halobium palmae]|uniref:LamG-like jellyroll fold domain-containing protein n=1 Tax=Halobium palmae TaxID=1776492 RepID=A0ABD5RV39_9EURY
MVNKTQTQGVLFALLLIVSPLAASGMFAGTAGADIGKQGTCKDDIAIGLLTGNIGETLYSNIVDPCINNKVDVDVDTKEEARRVVAREALEDKRYLDGYWTQFDQLNDHLSSPAKLDGKQAFSNAMRNGSTEVAAVTDARAAVHNRTASQQKNLWLQYRSTLDSLEGLEADAHDNQVDNLYFGYVDSDGEYRTGYTLRNYSEMGATVDVTLTDGSKVTVPTPYKAENGTVTDKLHPVNDDVLVTVFNPESGGNESVVNSAEIQRMYDAPTVSQSPDIRIDESWGVTSTDYVWSGTTSGVISDSAGTTSVSGLNGADQVTVMGAFRPNSSVANDDVKNVLFKAGDGSGSIQVREDSSGGLTVGVNPGSNWQSMTYSGFESGELHHYAVTYDSSSGDTTLYVDGNAVKSASLSTGLTVNSVTVGKANGKRYSGYVDDVRAYSGILNESGISELGERASPTPDLASHTNQFGDKHDRIEEIDDNAVAALGDETGGVLHSWKNHVENSDETWSSGYTAWERSRMTTETSDVGEQPWRAFQYTSLGFGGANTSYTVQLKVVSGSTVDGATISSNQTYAGQLFTSATPPNGTWSAGETYTVGGDSADVSAPIHMMRTVTEQNIENGTITYETRGKTSSIQNGTVKVVSVQNSDGAEIGSAGQIDRSPDTTNVSDLSSRIDSLQNTIETLRNQIDEDNDGDEEDGGVAGGGDTGDGGFSFDFGALGDLTLPFGSASVSFAALAIGGILVLVVVSQVGGIPMLLGAVFKGLFGKR